MKWYDKMFDLSMNVGHYYLYFMVQWFCFISERPERPFAILLWPIFHGLVILPCIWKPIWHINIISPDYEMVWQNVWPQYGCRSLLSIFYGPVILLYIWKTICHMIIILPDYEMVWHNVWPEYKCRSVWPIFHGPVILLYIFLVSIISNTEINIYF